MTTSVLSVRTNEERFGVIINLLNQSVRVFHGG